MDAELKRLSVRTRTIHGRDALSAVNASAALSSLARCRAVLDEFARRVYQTGVGSAAGTRAAGDVKLENNGGGARRERGNAANGPCQAR
jgi:hypothetical protein